MIFGEKKLFAIECDVIERTGNGWVFGPFLFWICGVDLGDPTDATDLKGCRNWLRNFVEEPRERYSEVLKGLSSEAIFAAIHFPTMPGRDAMPELDGLARFNIGHLGMSSFDRYDLLLVEFPSTAEQMLLWRKDDGVVEHALLPTRQLQIVARKCVEWMDTAF